MLLAFLAASMHCGFTLSLKSTRTPWSFLTELLLRESVPSLLCCLPYVCGGLKADFSNWLELAWLGILWTWCNILQKIPKENFVYSNGIFCTITWKQELPGTGTKPCEEIFLTAEPLITPYIFWKLLQSSLNMNQQSLHFALWVQEARWYILPRSLQYLLECNGS